MARFCSLFSGSSGNSIAVGCGGGYILIDAGKSAKKIKERLKQEDIPLEKLLAIFITHEHTDHISGMRVLASSLKVPVFATPGTADCLESAGHTAGVDMRVLPDGEVSVGNMNVTHFATSHDAADSCGFSVECGDGRRITIATDTGVITPEIHSAMCGSDLVYIEANHDVSMLYAGDYPYKLKQRIASDTGHLNNEVSSSELPVLARNGTARFILGHLSEHNNMPLLARQTAVCEFQKYGMTEGKDYLLSVAGPDGLRSMIF